MKWSVIFLVLAFVIIVVVFIFESQNIFFGERVWEKRIEAALEPVECSPVEDAEYPDSYYKGPLIDTHYHLPNLPQSVLDDGLEPALGRDIKMGEIVCNFKHEGTSKNFALFPVWPELPVKVQVEVVKRTLEQYPGFFVPFIQPTEADDIRPTVEAEALSEMLAVYPGLFKGWGELALYKQEEDLNDFPPDLPLFTEIYPIIREQNMMVWMHPGENQRDSFDRVLGRNPDIDFIVHGDEIKGDIEYLMDKHPNMFFCINDLYADEFMYFDYDRQIVLTKEAFFDHLENYEPLIQADLRNWKGLIEAHPDQVMWCLDRDPNILWTYDRDVGVKLTDYARAFIGRLDPAVQEKFAYKNAEGLLSG